MSKTRPPYTPEFRQKIVDLVNSGRSPEDLAKEFEPSSLSIRHWVAKANGITKNKSPVSQQVSAEEKKELDQLRKEIRILREERDILKKAAAWFAQETGAAPSRRSSS